MVHNVRRLVDLGPREYGRDLGRLLHGQDALLVSGGMATSVVGVAAVA